MKRDEKLKYEENLNKLLGVNIRFSRLSSEELIQLVQVLTDVGGLARKLNIKVAEEKTPQEKIAEGVGSLVTQWEGPVMRILKGLMEKEKEKKPRS